MFNFLFGNQAAPISVSIKDLKAMYEAVAAQVEGFSGREVSMSMHIAVSVDVLATPLPR